jgi:hypothetical protein
MKKAFFAIVLLAPALAWGKPKPADYSVAIHVQSSQLVAECYEALGHTFCEGKQHLSVSIDGRKYELNSKGESDFALRTGVYKAKLIVDDEPSTDNPPRAYEIHDVYEFLFPDGKTRKYSVVGESE